VPTLTITLVYHAAVAFFSYSQWTLGHSSAYALSMAMHGFFAAVGSWVILFGSSSGHISRKTGADKRTSGFPFKNAEADKRKQGKAF
jgi:hypothetical protein